MASPSRQTIDEPRLLICEGITDAAFFRALIDARGLPKFTIRTTSDSGGAGGNSGFEVFLRGVPAWPGFYSLQHILVVADNDTNPVDEFNAVVAQITNAQPSATPPVTYGLPTQPAQRVPGMPATMSILMMPWTEAPGNLETICRQAIQTAHAAISACVDQFAACAGSSVWPLSDLSKMQVSAFLAGKHRANPFLGLQHVWTDDPTLIPLTDPCFDQIATFLATF